ncbi:transcription-repair coupling factor [Candidatus Peregrinibacteria bacterium]|nr:transcription-repair coupling factor [Candidatus Peregrinibacteria bacterium]
MRNIISFFPKEELKEATDLFRKNKNVSYSGVGNSSSKALIISDILRDDHSAVGNTLWVTNGEDDFNKVYKALHMWSDRPVYTYRKLKDDKRGAYGTYREFERAKRLKLVEFVLRILTNKKAVFVIEFESLLQNFPDVMHIKDKKLEIKEKDGLDLVEFVEALVSGGYEITDDDKVEKGQYLRIGDSLLVYPVNSENPIRIDMDFDNVEKISVIDENDYSNVQKTLKSVEVFPLNYDYETNDIIDLLEEDGLIIDDEVDTVDENYDVWNSFMDEAGDQCGSVAFTSFNSDEARHAHLHYLSILKYRTGYDFGNDLRDKISAGWKILFFTKHMHEARGLLADQKVPFRDEFPENRLSTKSVYLINVQKEDVFPQSFQNPKEKIVLFSDIEVPFLKGEEKKEVDRNVFNDFLMGLKPGDAVVHADHGIAKFLGLEKKTVDAITKEYMKLGYAENDKLFVPIDQADKVNKYIGSEELMPKLTRLGSAEWNTITSRVKKETQKIAKELLNLYAERKAAKGIVYKQDNDMQKQFEDTFPYDETPGQIKAINDVKSDMEKKGTMDRLICGDVGFGKTEVAMRGAFKAVMNNKQVAVVSPITILADQHYKSFRKRMDQFNVRIEMLSRFRKVSEQKKILEKLKKGEIDIIIGTHRLLQPDVAFKKLGLVIIDEEQRFGVKQKEVLKDLKKEVDVLTLTATPIPRTLNICLNKLRDITTITTPPFGRLPVITEVRKYSATLVREAIMKEVERGGQVYFLHNRVQTIDSFAEKLKTLVPEARFIVAHGKLGAGDLEERIMDFKEGKFDVLVSSTIIENGIDLSNANTLIVNNADKFGLSQLYQLRGRVGRGKAQAFAYFLYHGQRLKLDAKKRLRAIVEASDLGSGFQIAMKDLEIRGAGDILGANQHGVINVVGVAHFMRMLNKAVADLKAGRIREGLEEIKDVSIELPVPAYIPDNYILDSNDKINAYQRLSSADSLDYLQEIQDDLVSDYGRLPREVNNLFRIIELKIKAKDANLLSIRAETVPMSKDKEIVLTVSKRVKPANIISLLEHNSDFAITGSRLRINMKDLGKDWFTELKKCVEALGKSAKHGAR